MAPPVGGSIGGVDDSALNAKIGTHGLRHRTVDLAALPFSPVRARLE
jgi:hypothetical protein